MNELIQALRRFVARDLVYLTGGACVVASFGWAAQRLPSRDNHAAVYLLLAGISYIVGHALQDGFSLLPGFTTTIPHKLNWYQRFFYKRLTRTDWEDVPEALDFTAAEDQLDDERQLGDLERFTVLHQLASTVGPCALVSSVFLGIAWYRGVDSPFSLALGVSALSIGLLMSHLAWAKAGQRAQYLASHTKGDV